MLYDAVKELPAAPRLNGGLMLAGQGVNRNIDGKVSLYEYQNSFYSFIEKASVQSH